MSELERSVEQWRQTLAATPGLTADAIAELESHLREEIQRLRAGGDALYYLATAPEFFGPIVRRLGDAGLTREELLGRSFVKILEARRKKGKL